MHKNRSLQKIQDDAISEQRQKYVYPCRIASRYFCLALRIIHGCQKPTTYIIQIAKSEERF